MSEASQMITKEAKEQLLSLMIDEMKEAQLKLGYAKEVIRLYIPMQSLCAILQIPPCDANQLCTMLQSEFSAEPCVLGQIVFTACKVTNHQNHILQLLDLVNLKYFLFRLLLLHVLYVQKQMLQ